MASDVFDTKIANDIYLQKYSMDKVEKWKDTCKRVVESVCGQLLDSETKEKLLKLMIERKFIPGGRYLYSAGRPYHQVNNCFLYRAEDSREGWADIMQKTTNALMSGGGIGIDYSPLREEGSKIKRTGGESTGPLAHLNMVNEAGRYIMQGGQRRCLPETTRITMSDGSRKLIKDIKVGDSVLTRLGPKKVTNKFDQGDQQVIKVITKYGTTYSTANHKWLAADRTRRKTWMTTKDLSLNNKLYYHPYKEKNEGKSMSLDTAYLLGYFVGDGCAYSSGRTHEVTFQFSNDHYSQDQVDKISKIMSEKGSNPILRKGHGNCTELRCRSKALVKEFQQIKYPNNAPKLEWLKEYNVEVVAAFMAGWFDADGYLGEDSWKLSNVHSETRTEAIQLFTRLGFLSKENGVEVRICSYQKARFKKEIGKYMYKKFPAFKHETSEIPARILSIEYGRVEPTWDIEVEDVHEFFADNFVSHNSAIWAGLLWSHPDIFKFMHLKDWPDAWRVLKKKDPNFPLPMELTNISNIYNTEFFIAMNSKKHEKHNLAKKVWIENCKQAFSTAEPGFSFNFRKDNESLRNACSEVVSEDDSDKCNLGTVWINRFTSKEEFAQACELATQFLLCGGIYSDVPTDKVREIGLKNNRIGLGLGGLHEWLMARGNEYQVVPELHKWLSIYEQESDSAAFIGSRTLNVMTPKGVRAIAPNGTIGILAETTTGIEPLYSKAYKKQYLKGKNWVYQFVVDGTVKRLLDQGIKLEQIKDSYDIGFRDRVKFQADVQNYVDMSISSTCNMPAWGHESNNESNLEDKAKILLKYAKRLRGFTCYPDGSRDGQPLERVSLEFALKQEGLIFDAIEQECLHGVCGI